MNPYRNERGGVYMRRGHTDELDETKLQGIIESLQRFASATDTTLDQAIKVYECATVSLKSFLTAATPSMRLWRK